MAERKMCIPAESSEQYSHVYLGHVLKSHVLDANGNCILSAVGSYGSGEMAA